MSFYSYKTSPTVSVVIPCFNGIKYVADAIRSAFDQTYPPIEVIVVDDGSTDGTLEYLELLRKEKYHDLVILTHPNHVNKGVSASRHLGIWQSKGEYIAFLDCDDIFFPDKLQVQIELFALFPDVVLCHSGIKIIGDCGSPAQLEAYFSCAPGYPYSLCDQSYYLKLNKICNSSVLVIASEIKKVAFSAPLIFQYEDWAYWSLLSERGKFFIAKNPLLYYRVHEHSFTYDNTRSTQKQLFSRLEFQLVLLSRTQSLINVLRIPLLILETIRELYKSYHPKGTSKNTLGTCAEATIAYNLNS